MCLLNKCANKDMSDLENLSKYKSFKLYISKNRANTK